MPHFANYCKQICSTTFDFLVISCSFFLYSLVPGSSRRTFRKLRPSTDPDVRLYRIRLLIWLIVFLISVYPTLFSLKSISSSCQFLCIGQVSFLDITICGSLPSSGITHLLRCRVREIPSSFSLP